MSIKIKIKETLFTIDSILLSIYPTVKDQGLIYGKMGACLFFFHFAKYQNSRPKNENAHFMTSNLIENLENIDFDYERGLSGIFKGLQYLNKYDFIELEPDFFSEVNTHLIGQYKNLDISINSLGRSLFLSDQLFDNNVDKELENLIYERILFHLDLIDKRYLSPRNYKLDTFLQNIVDQHSFNMFNSHIKEICRMVEFVTQTYKNRHFSAFTGRILKKYASSVDVLLKLFYQLVILKPESIKNFKLEINELLLMLFKSYQIVQSENIKNNSMTKNFLEMAIHLNEDLAFEQFYSKNLLTHINNWVSLNKINSILKNTNISLIEKKILTKILAELTSKKIIIETFKTEESEVNIGLTGISGFGISLINYFKKDKKRENSFCEILN